MAIGRRGQFWDGMRTNFLIGITAGKWAELRRVNRVDPGCRDRAALIRAASVINSLYAWHENRRCGEQIAAVKETLAPLFILGHWRSGTTHLHNLLAQDAAQFAYPTNFQVVFPHAFLTAEEKLTRWLARVTPRQRLMDNMAMALDSPQEDEHALALLTLRSPYLGMGSFPRSEARYTRYLDFHGVPESERAEWRGAFHWLIRKLSLKHGRRRLVLKSPGHTARIRLLLEMFPEARFVHIIRDPFVVFQSMRHMTGLMWRMVNLQHPGSDPVEERILRWYRQMYEAFFRDVPLIPAGRFHELRFEDLERDPVGQVRLLYDRLGLPGYELFRPQLEAYVASLSGYRKNQFPELPPDMRSRVAHVWQRSFEEWAYPC